MRIFIASSSVVPTPPHGYGSERMIYLLARELASMGHEVVLAGVPNRRRFYEEYGIEFRPIPCSYGRVSYGDEWRTVEWYGREIETSDAVIDASATCIVTEALHWRLKHVPHAFWRNGIDFSHPRFARHCAVVLSKLARECAIKGLTAYDDGTKQIGYRDARVVNYGLDLSDFEPSYEKDRYLVWISRFHRDKGVFDVLRLAKKMPKVRFVLAGSTEFPDHRRTFVEVRKIAESLPNVELVPDPDEKTKHELIRRAAAFIYPLRYREAFGLVIIEALALGTPVLTHKRFVTPELWPGIEELSEEAIERALRFEYRYEDLRRFVEQNFTARHMAEKWLEIINDVVKGVEW